MRDKVNWKKAGAFFLLIFFIFSISRLWPAKSSGTESELANTDDYAYVETIILNENSYKVKLKNDEIKEIDWRKIENNEIVITGYTTQNQRFRFDTSSDQLVKLTKEKNIPVEVATDGVDNSRSLLLLISIFGAFFAFIYLIPRKSPEAALSSKDSSNYEFKPEQSNTDFSDIAGLEEVKEELEEISLFLKEPEPFKKLGAKIPKGVILYGPPGTGKTLLAKAIAADAKATFFATSGSTFVEKYVGVGASRIRDIFSNAKKKAPSIIFIDEIDAVGRSRNEEGNSERDQTLNQLLVEMDGFNSNETVVVIAATNRLDILDSALLRPGRFDRHVYVGPPDMQAREAILKVHTKNKPLDKSVDLIQLARKTHGLTGAYLANLTNEAAILAARKKKQVISSDEFDSALERVIAGLEKKNTMLTERDRIVIAFHEAGHALVGKMLNTDVVEKISIVPRGQALGYVLQLPSEDRFITTKEELLSKICVFLGGRVAEEVVFRDVSTGAQNDLEKVTELAYDMVCKYGMSTEVGVRIVHPKWNQNLDDLVEKEVREIIKLCHQNTKEVIIKNNNKLEEIAYLLLEKESINRKEIDAIFQ